MRKIKNIRFYIISIITCISFSCVNKKNDKSEYVHKIGKYVYIDTHGVLHSEKDCIALTLLDNRGVEFIETQKIQLGQLKCLCSDCIEDEDFEVLNTLIEERINDERKKIYNKFIDANYDMGEYHNFICDIKDSIKRRKLYNAAIKEGFNVGTFHSFSCNLGFPDY